METIPTTAQDGRDIAADLSRNARSDAADANKNNVVFLVRVLTQPLTVNANQIAILMQNSFVPPSFTTTNDDSGAIRPYTAEEQTQINAAGGQMRIQFMGRIIKGRGDGKILSPHAFIRNPCKLRFGATEERIRKLVSKHTKFISKSSFFGNSPKIGDIVQVTLQKSDFDGPQLKIAYFDELVSSSDNETMNMQDEQDCYSLIEVMGGDAPVSQNTGNSVGGIPVTADGTLVTDDGQTINEAAASAQYDPNNEHGFPPPQIAQYNGSGGTQTITNGAIPENLLGQPNSEYSNSGSGIKILIDVLDDYNRLAQAFYEHFGYKLPIGQCMRCYSGGPYCQVELKIEKPTLAATPGTSLHGWAVAFDMNTRDSAVGLDTGHSGFEGEIYEWMFLNAPQYNWENPKWAQDPDTSTALGIPCVRPEPDTRPCGTKKEAWHWEHTRGYQLISNRRNQ
jgi:hypothetical protein